MVAEPGETIHFAEVMVALERYARETGAQPLMLGGWEAEHPAISPPPSLLRQLAERSPHVQRYTYARDMLWARYEAADLFGASVSFAGEPLTERHVSIQQNSTQALLLTLAALKERGARRVVIAAPAYYAVVAICRSLSLETTVVPATDFMTGALDSARLREATRRPGSVALVTNPAYSLGVEYTPAALQSLLGALSPATWVLLDETRLGLSWRYEAPWDRADLSPRAIVVRSPSKIFFVHGRKTSLLLGEPALLREAEQLGEALVGSLPGDAEVVALAYLAAWRLWRDEVATGTVGLLRRWRRGVLAALQQNLAAAACAFATEGFHFSPIDSGPYVLAAAPRERLPHLRSVDAAREQGVLLMHGGHFLHEHPDWRGFRINLCSASDHQAEALSRLRALWRLDG